MSKSYKLKVNNTLEVDVSKKDIETLDAINTTDNTYHVLHNNASFKAEVTSANFNNKNYQVKVNNNTYNVAIADDLDQLIDQMGFSIGHSIHVDSIKAPMPGLILEINVAVGQSVEEDDALMILEAMKMENIITSPRDGVIKSISVVKGDAVEKNQLLLEFE